MYFWRLGGDQDMCRCNWVLLSPGLGWSGDWHLWVPIGGTLNIFSHATRIGA